MFKSIINFFKALAAPSVCRVHVTYVDGSSQFANIKYSGMVRSGDMNGIMDYIESVTNRQVAKIQVVSC